MDLTSPHLAAAGRHLSLTLIKGFANGRSRLATVSKSSHFFMRALVVVLIFTGQCTATPGQQSVSKAELTSIVQPERGLLEWHFKGLKLLAYVFATNQFKPYVRELYSLAGDNVLRDAPADHLHHHGLMYAIRINGVNFWEERDQPGYERHLKLLAHGTCRGASGLPQASFTELVHWVPHGDHTLPDTTPAALLVERRTLTLTVDEEKAEAALAWHAEFEVGARTNHVKLHGSEYNGLGLRLPAAWDRVARHGNSENAPYSSGGNHDVLPAQWSAVSHVSEGRTTQVVLCARPHSEAGRNCFFTMTEPFTYLSATQGLDKTPLEYRSGDRFSLDYLVLVSPRARPSAQLESRYRAWASELK